MYKLSEWGLNVVANGLTQSVFVERNANQHIWRSILLLPVGIKRD